MSTLPCIFGKSGRWKLTIAILALLVASSSCVSTQRLARQQLAATFQSYPNGVADIELELKPSGRFVLDMSILPVPGDEDPTADQIRMKGRWKISDAGYQLRFFRRNRPELEALVGKDYYPDTNLSAIDERTLMVPSNQSEIVIWGVKCFKK